MTSPLTSTFSKLSPAITTMIRMDHTHVLALFHKYHAETGAWRKKSIAEAVCLALEVHAQLEEEVFYPALREVLPPPTGLADSTPEIRALPLPHSALREVLDESKPEHDEMRALIAKLRGMKAGDQAFDDTFHTLMRAVMHHVADEETTLLPTAERLLADRLRELGTQMTKLRLKLLAPKTPQVALHHAKALPLATLLMTVGTVLAGGYLIGQALERNGRH